MRTNPVSFGSIHVFTINDGKPKLPIPISMKIAFQNNPALTDYKLSELKLAKNDKRDGTVHNAFKKFSKALDKEYKSALQQDPKRVILTQADFYVNPRDKQPRYFLTAATNDDEAKILNALNDGTDFFAARFYK